MMVMSSKRRQKPSNRVLVAVIVVIVVLIVLYLTRRHPPAPDLQIPVTVDYTPPPESRMMVSYLINSYTKQIYPKEGCSLHPDTRPPWVPLPTCGCFLQDKFANLDFKCLPAISITQDMGLEDVRDRYYKHILRKHVTCGPLKRYGNRDDGGWDTCAASVFKIKSPCTIYSFGIRDDWTFDEAISQEAGCQVYAFDPSIGKGDHKHSENIWFFNRGLGGKTEVNDKGWNMKTLKDIIQELGHTNKTIDYLKFDIEFSEWVTLDNMIKDGVLRNIKQVAFEVHTWRDSSKDYVYFWRLLQTLENMGFQRWSLLNLNWQCFRAKENGKRYCPQANMAFINTNFLRIRH